MYEVGMVLRFLFDPFICFCATIRLSVVITRSVEFILSHRHSVIHLSRVFERCEQHRVKMVLQTLTSIYEKMSYIQS